MRSKPVTADYVHSGIFVPVLELSPEINCFTFNPLGNAATKLAYWDQEAWASELKLSESSSATEILTGSGPSAVDSSAAPMESDGPVQPDATSEGKVKKRKVEAKETTKQKKVAN